MTAEMVQAALAEITAERDALRKRVEELEMALNKYGTCLESCRSVANTCLTGDCGFEKSLSEALKGGR